MQKRTKQLGFLFLTFLLLSLLSACSLFSSKTSSSAITTKKAETSSSSIPTKDAPTPVSTLTIKTAAVNQDQKWLNVTVQMENDTSTAQLLKPELFALVVDNTILSPVSKSDIPSQIPAGTTAEFKIVFDQKNLGGTYNARLAYQPIDNSKPQQFFSINNLVIKKTEPASPVKKDASPAISLTSRSFGSIGVKVPTGWIESPIEGGDFGGSKCVNPKDGNQVMSVVTSACAGCGFPEANPDAKPDPKSLIPHTDITNSSVFNKGLSAGYTYYDKGNPYRGDGVITMKRYDGYAYVEITLPNSERSVASQILNSFVFNGVTGQ